MLSASTGRLKERSETGQNSMSTVRFHLTRRLVSMIIEYTESVRSEMLVPEYDSCLRASGSRCRMTRIRQAPIRRSSGNWLPRRFWLEAAAHHFQYYPMGITASRYKHTHARRIRSGLPGSVRI